MIFTITAPSGAGKTTLLSGLSRTKKVRPLQSVTTRPPRSTDEEGEYMYTSDELFRTFVDEGIFLWHVAIHGNRYGTRKEDVIEALKSGALYVAILVPSATEQLHEYAKEHNVSGAVRSVYLYFGDEEELRSRLVIRGDKTGDIERRIEECKTWNTWAQNVSFPLYIVDAQGTRDEVLAQAQDYFYGK